MRGFRILAAAACLPLVMAVGCGGANTYNPAIISGPTPDFVLTAYTGDAESVGNGNGLSPNTSGNPAGVNLNASVPVTVVIKSIHTFSGTLTLSAGSSTGHFTVSAMNPASASVSSGGTVDSTITVSPTQAAVAGNAGAVTISATSGNKTHTITVYYKVLNGA